MAPEGETETSRKKLLEDSDFNHAIRKNFLTIRAPGRAVLQPARAQPEARRSFVQVRGWTPAAVRGCPEGREFGPALSP